MRKLIWSGVCVLSFILMPSVLPTAKPHSVMAGIQNVVTPVMHAQLWPGSGGVPMECSDAYAALGAQEINGLFFEITGIEIVAFYETWAVQEVDFNVYYNYFGPYPGYFDCLYPLY